MNNNDQILKDLQRIRETMEKNYELTKMERVNREHIFTKLKLTRDEFDNLIFMGPPPPWKRYLAADQFPLKLCFRKLKDVVEELRNSTKGNPDDPCSVFKELEDVKTPNEDGSDEAQSWFYPHSILCEKFDKRLMPPLWIRNVTKWGNETEHGGGPFYVEDGNHRALVYAMRITCGKDKYEPVDAIHATSWDFAEGILGYLTHEASGLQHDGRLHLENRVYRGGFGARIKVFERLE